MDLVLVILYLYLAMSILRLISNLSYLIKKRKKMTEELEEEKKLNAENERLALVDRVNELEKLTIAVDEDRDNAQKRINEYILTICNKDKQLTEAKEIIKSLCGMVRELNNPNVQLTNVDYSLSEAEQFLRGELDK